MKLLILFFSSLICFKTNAQITLKYQEGHTGFLEDIRYSQDGKYLLTSATDKTLIVWDIASGIQLRTLKKEGCTFEHFDFLPDQDYIIGGNSYNDLSIWNWKTGTFNNTIENPEKKAVNDFAFRPGFSQLAVAYGNILSGSSYWILYSFPELEKIDSQNFENQLIGNIEFSHDGKILALGTEANASNLFGGSNQHLMLFDMASRKIIQQFEHKFDVGTICFSHDNRVVGSAEKRVYGHKESGPRFRFWDVSTGQEIHQMTLETRSASYVSFSPDDKFVSLAYSNAEKGGFDVEIRSTKTFEIQRKFETKTNQLAMFSPNGKRVLCANTTYHLIEEFDVSTASITSNLSSVLRKVKTFDVSPDSKIMASGNQSAFDKTVKIWDLRTGRVTHWLKEHRFHPQEIKFSPDGRLLASVAKDGLRVWRVQDWTLVFSDTTMAASCLGWSKNAELVLGYADGKIAIINVLELNPSSIKPIQVSESAIESIDIRGANLAIRWKGQIAFVSPGNSKVYEVNSSNYSALFLNDSTIVADGLRGIYLIDVISDKVEKLEQNETYTKSICISPDGKYILTGTGNSLISIGDLHVWDVAKKEMVEILKFHNLSVSALKFDTNGRLYSGSKDGKIAVWNWKERRVLATLVANEEEFITATPESHYTLSKNGHRFVVFEKDDKIYSVDQFDLMYNRPDKVLEALSPESVELIDLYRKAINKRHINLSQSQLSENIGNVEVEVKNASQIPLEIAASNIKLLLKVSSSDFPLDRLDIWVNGVYQKKISHTFTNKSISESLEIDVPLGSGQNMIEVGASCMNGLQSLRERVFIRSTSNTKSNLYVLCLSVSNYQDSSYNLKYAVKDGRDIARFFSTSEVQNTYGKIFIDTIFNENQTKENLNKLILKYQNLSINDVFIVFISGHGLLDDKNRFYLASYDVDFDHPEKNGVPFTMIDSMLANCPALKKILLIDACHSGLVDKDETNSLVIEERSEVKLVGSFSRGGKSTTTKKVDLENSFYLSQELFMNLNRGSGAQVISAAAGNAYAYESSEWQNGVFTFSILKGLSSGEADQNRDKKVSVTELRDFVTTEVIKQTQGRQHPTSRQENIHFDWTVW